MKVVYISCDIIHWKDEQTTLTPDYIKHWTYMYITIGWTNIDYKSQSVKHN